MQALEAIAADMQAADAEHSFSREVPTWAATLTALRAAIGEEQGFSGRLAAGTKFACSGSPEGSAPGWEDSLEQAVTSVLLWAQNASKPQGMLRPLSSRHLLIKLCVVELL